MRPTIHQVCRGLRTSYGPYVWSGRTGRMMKEMTTNCITVLTSTSLSFVTMLLSSSFSWRRTAITPPDTIAT